MMWKWRGEGKGMRSTRHKYNSAMRVGMGHHAHLPERFFLYYIFLILNSFYSNSNLLPPLSSCFPNPFDTPPLTLTHELTWQGGFLPPCHVEKHEST